ncbi:MAG: hypothetical protein ABIF10_07080 [Candidatus Woesearchaeota archaeon]
MAVGQMTCESCKKTVPISDVKYIMRGEKRQAMCKNCREKMKEAKQDKSQQRRPYFCVRCKYKFKHKPTNQALLKCPYCGKGDKVIENIAPSADRLLKEIDME